jgi:threonine/homoserine/homoserine lactone efflux protein
VPSLLSPQQIIDLLGTPLLLRGFALGFVIAASPGPVFFLCLRRTLLSGWRIGFLSGLGVATADGMYAAVAVFGVAALTDLLLGGARWLALIGGAALVVLGVRAIIERPAPREAAVPAGGRGLAWAYASTLGLTITNPATIISFAALAAALGAGLAGGFLRPASVVVGVFAGSAAWWAVLATLATALRSRITPAVARGIGVASGVAIVALGALAIVAALGH